MTYPQQYQPQMPQYPQQAPPVQPTPYPPQQQPYAYPVPQWQPPVQPPTPPVAPLATGSLSEFFSQPVGGGPGWSWKDKPIGHSYAGVVKRAIRPGDIQQSTSPQGIPLAYNDGRPKFEMRVPMQVQQSPEFPQGEATWYVRGKDRDELARAMTEAGCPQEVISNGPEAGAGVMITLTERRPGRMGNPSNIVRVQYQRPANAGNGVPAQTAPPVQQAPPQPQQPAYTGPVPATQPAPQTPVQGVPQQAPPGVPGLSADAIAQLEKMTGQPYTGPRA